MNASGSLLPRLGVSMLAAIAGLIAPIPALAESEPCHLASQHAGLSFPVERVEAIWNCRLHAIIENYTTANRVGPISTPLPEAVYLSLLNHPPMTAALINRLDLALYRAEQRGPGRYWGSDGEGTEGIVELVYQDRATRIYYLEGTHESRVLPPLSGKAVIFLRMHRLSEANGIEAMETTMVSYTRLDNRVLSGIASLLRPLIGGTVTRKLAKGVETVNQLSRIMRREPDRVMFEALDPPPFGDDEVVLLRQALATVHHPTAIDRLSAAP
jgi:hypothetical protein